MDLGRAVLVHEIAENACNIIFKNDFFLIDSFKQLAAQAINCFALLVHYVVVFENMFAGFEVLGFDGLLGSFDSPGDQARLDGNAFFHAQPL